MSREVNSSEERVGYDFETPEDAEDFAEWLLSFTGKKLELEECSVTVPLGVAFTQASLNRLVDDWEESQGELNEEEGPDDYRDFAGPQQMGQ